MASRAVLFTVMFAVAVCHAQGVAVGVEPLDGVEELPSLPLSGSAVGVIAGDVNRLMKSYGLIGPPDSVGFASGLAKYRWMYLSCDAPQAESVILPVGLEGKQRKSFKQVCLATVQLLKSQGIDQPYSLVRVIVNGGLGCPSSAAFVATEIKRVDGTDEYPIDVTKIVQVARDEFAARLLQSQATVDHDLRALVEKTFPRAKSRLNRDEAQDVYVTWLPDKEKLYVRFRRSVAEGESKRAIGAHISPDAAEHSSADKKGAGRGIPVGTIVGVTSQMEFEFSKTGEPVGRGALSVREFKKELPSPREGARPSVR